MTNDNLIINLRHYVIVSFKMSIKSHYFGHNISGVI